MPGEHTQAHGHLNEQHPVVSQLTVVDISLKSKNLQTQRVTAFLSGILFFLNPICKIKHKCTNFLVE